MSNDKTPLLENEDDDTETQTRTSRRRDPEALALQQILWQLDDLGEEGAERVVAWIHSRHVKKAKEQQFEARR